MLYPQMENYDLKENIQAYKIGNVLHQNQLCTDMNPLLNIGLFQKYYRGLLNVGKLFKKN